MKCPAWPTSPCSFKQVVDKQRWLEFLHEMDSHARPRWPTAQRRSGIFGPVGGPAGLALAGLSRTPAGRWLGDGADVPVISQVAADASELGRALGLTPSSDQSGRLDYLLQDFTPDGFALSGTLVHLASHRSAEK